MGNEHQADDSRDGLGKTIWQAVERITQLEEAVRVLATNLRSYIMDQAVGDWTQDISDEVNANPIAAEAVLKAGG
jgi:hypothetical protein